MGEELYVPREVANMVKIIEEGTAKTPEVQRIADRRYRITILNARVHCTVDYKFTGNRWDWASSKLAVDGKPHELMPSATAFFQLFHNPESDGLKRVDPASIPILEPMPSGHLFASVTEYLEDRIRQIDPLAAAAMMLAGKQPVLEIRLSRGLVRWAVHDSEPELLLFVFDGFDVSHRAGKTMEEVFTFLADQHGVLVPAIAQQVAFPHNAANPATVSNAVRVRRQTVIRI